MPLNRYPDQDEEATCKGCKLLKTKPENIPDDLAPFVARAIDLSEIEHIGGRFDYPDALEAVEWEALRALSRGRDKADSLKRKRDKQKK